jgi:methyl-accepting chemotaxis protein
MELVLALLLAVSLVGLATTWSALRTERERSRRLRDHIAAARPEAVPHATEPIGEPWPAPEPLVPVTPPAPVPEPPSPAPIPSPSNAPFDRLAAALVAPAERLATSIGASEPTLAAAAERLRTPIPPPAPVSGVEDVDVAGFRVEGLEEAVATAERVSDERSRLADDVRSLRGSLERASALDGGLGRSLTELARTADTLLPLASSVSGLADRANLLGLNVSLLAARAGEAGAPFEEAATELRGLFEEARRLSRELSEIARRTEGGNRRIAALVQESTGSAAASRERAAHAGERVSALDGLCDRLDLTLGEALRTTRAAAEGAGALARQLESARASLEARSGESARLRADAEETRAALRAAAERIEALRLDGGALRAAVARVTPAA